VANDSNLDDVLCVVDSVDDPVIADANSPQVIAALKFFAATGCGCWVSASIFATIRSTTFCGSDSSSFVADRTIRTSGTATAFFQATGLPEAAPDSRPVFARLTLSQSCCGNVENIFPEAASLPEIDHHGCFFTALVKEEFHAANHERVSGE
jgi:hypothetical protein